VDVSPFNINTLPKGIKAIKVADLINKTKAYLAESKAASWLITQNDKIKESSGNWVDSTGRQYTTNAYLLGDVYNKAPVIKCNLGVVEINAHGSPDRVDRWGLVDKKSATELGAFLKSYNWDQSGYIIISACDTGISITSTTWQALANVTGKIVYAAMGPVSGTILGGDAQVTAWTIYPMKPLLNPRTGQNIPYFSRGNWDPDKTSTGSIAGYYREFDPQ
jgi:hypothetical protein